MIAMEKAGEKEVEEKLYTYYGAEYSLADAISWDEHLIYFLVMTDKTKQTDMHDWHKV